MFVPVVAANEFAKNTIWFVDLAVKLVTLFNFSSEATCITTCKTGSDLFIRILSFAPVSVTTEWSWEDN